MVAGSAEKGRKEVLTMISAGLTNKQRKAIYRRDGFQCALCGYHESLQLHHVIPRGKGGSDSEENIITLCSKCHMQVHGYEVYAFPDADEVEQACVEYLADMYTDVVEEGDKFVHKVWNPYKDEWVL